MSFEKTKTYLLDRNITEEELTNLINQDNYVIEIVERSKKVKQNDT
jgi:hypothetical protein